MDRLSGQFVARLSSGFYFGGSIKGEINVQDTGGRNAVFENHRRVCRSNLEIEWHLLPSQPAASIWIHARIPPVCRATSGHC